MTAEVFDDGAPSPAVATTVVPGGIAVIATVVALPATALALVGTALMTVGVGRGKRRLHTMGAALTFGGVLLAAAFGGPPVFALVGSAAAVLAWDAGEHAIGLGRQVGCEASARRAVLVHAGASTVAAIVILLLATVVYLFARTGQPGTAAGVLVVAAGLFALLLSR